MNRLKLFQYHATLMGGLCFICGDERVRVEFDYCKLYVFHIVDIRSSINELDRIK